MLNYASHGGNSTLGTRAILDSRRTARKTRRGGTPRIPESKHKHHHHLSRTRRRTESHASRESQLTSRVATKIAEDARDCSDEKKGCKNPSCATRISASLYTSDLRANVCRLFVLFMRSTIANNRRMGFGLSTEAKTDFIFLLIKKEKVIV